MDFKIIFGERVAKQRKTLCLTQQQLGDMVGLTKQAINDIEHGRRNTLVPKAVLIAKSLNTTVEYLAGATDDPKRY